MPWKIPEDEGSKWLVLVGLVVAVLGVLVMARLCDVREKEVLEELARSEARAARAEDQLMVARLRSTVDVAGLRRQLAASRAEAASCRSHYNADVVDALRKVLNSNSRGE